MGSWFLRFRRVFVEYNRTPTKGPTMGTHSYREFYKGIPSVGERSLVAQTCDSCGLILGSKHYRRTRFNTWPRTCVTCVNRRYRQKHPESDARLHAIRHAVNEETRKTATNFNKFWTLQDLDFIAQKLEEGLKHREIAVLMNRTLQSIRGAVTRFGLSDGWPSRDEWVIRKFS